MNNSNVLRRGLPVQSARKAMIMLHGRGATASGIMELSDNLKVEEFHLIAPQAPSNEWYPYRFMETVEKNEPWLSKSLGWIEQLIQELIQEGIKTENIFFLGFSQGACLATEYLARYGGRYGGVFALSGGLIGKQPDRSKYNVDLKGTPVLMGCGDIDHHIPESRVRETAEILSAMGASVETRIYKGMEHTINQDELDYVNSVLSPD